MRTSLAFVSAVMALALPAVLHPAADARAVTAWTNGKWFDGTASGAWTCTPSATG